MSNSTKLKSWATLAQEVKGPADYLAQADVYWAHRLAHNQDKETLAEHIDCVLQQSCRLFEAHQLDGVVDRLLLAVFEAFPKKEQLLLGNRAKIWMLNAVVFHDFGKVNPNFQVEKMKNPQFRKLAKHSFKSFHAPQSAILYLVQALTSLDEESEEDDHFFALISLIYAFSQSILKHHASALEDYKTEQWDIWQEADLSLYFEAYAWTNKGKATLDLLRNCFLNLKGEETPQKDKFPIYALSRLLFSVLTASDYLGTAQYMQSLTAEDFELGVFSKARKKELAQTLKTSTAYNKATYELAENQVSLVLPKEKSPLALNQLRQAMAVELLDQLKTLEEEERLFYIEAPTGGGKTNLSVLTTMRLLERFPGANKVYYVFPFTSLIEQTSETLVQLLGLREEEWIALHAKADFKAKKAGDTAEGQANYGADQMNFIDYQFLHYPLVLLSHVRFFNFLVSPKKSDNYILHRLANSVVVLDEIQSYPPHQWDKLFYFISKYAHYFNMRFVLMSATLPKLEALILEKGLLQKEVNYLLKGAKTRFFQNANFAQRLRFDFGLLEREDISLDDLAQEVFRASVAYSQLDLGKVKPKGSVHTIIEFIFKKSAAEFILKMKEDAEIADFFDQIFLLSGTVLGPRRKAIIHYLKNPDYRNQRILVVSTQVVEAGVDIDMDIGFKNQSLLDSDEQLAGRINRNLKKEGAELYLFKHNEPKLLYARDLRYKMTKGIAKEDYRRILEQKDFDFLYQKVMLALNEWNKGLLNKNLASYLLHLQQLDYQKAQEDFQLISQKNISVYVPLVLPFNDLEQANFSADQLLFLERFCPAAIGPEGVDAAEVFAVYLALILNPGEQYIQQQILLKQLQAIMAKFVFSLFDTPALRRQLAPFIDPEKSEYGYLYLLNWESLYSVEDGLNEQQFQASEQQFL